MKTFTDCAAQGDLLIRRINAIPAGATPIQSEDGKFVVAHSETGHNHIIAERPNVKLYTTGDPMVSYLEVVEATDAAETLLEHLRSYDTHETIAIPPGVFEVRRQREYTPEGWRQIQD
ncbi:hypothetical protein [Pseudothauera rhizosphaerae]|uniref:Doublecortin domain-containing protein n=1 Tax=Pseudothauera rhizosphaerae TaxID=2565932 RepID=A0A4S4AWD9_9RHOO|nr:hypothetical protein [Pseudothauera rhizosphaerae]THF64352.1 hypothetical protein E6O51_03315 [Pseudothauera rhizosphaerae]